MARASIAVTSSDTALQSRHNRNQAALPGVESGSIFVNTGLSEHKLTSALSDTLSSTSSLRRISASENMLFLSRDYFSYHRKLRTDFFDAAVYFYGFHKEVDRSLVAVRKANFSASENPLA
jgi:hypothetical protein